MDASSSDRRTRSTYVLLVAGICLIGLAAVVLAGWVSHNLTILQLLPHAPLMRFNTALLFLLVGVGLVALSQNRRPVARCLGLLVVLIAALTASQDFLGIDYGIDNLLFADWTVAGTTASGRMVVNVALCFVLTGLCLISQSFPCRYRCQPLVECLISSVVLGIAAVAASGYASGLAASYGWASQAGMALHTAIAFALVGAALGVASLAHERKWSEGTPAWLPLPVGLAVLAMNVVSLQALCLDHRVQFDRGTALRAAKLAEHIESRLTERTHGLEQMAHRWNVAGQPLRRHWQADAALFLQHMPDVEALAWVDPTETIRWIAPLAGNEALLNRDVSRDPVRHRALVQARDRRRAVITPIIELAQGGQGLVVVCPIYRLEQHEGFCSAAFRLDDLVNELAREDLQSGYQVAILCGQRQVYGPSFTEHPTSSRMATGRVGAGDEPFQVCVWPSPAAIAAQGTAVRNTAIATGILRTVLAVLFAHLTVRARDHARVAKQAVARARESEWRFRAVFDQTFQFVGLLTTDGTLVDANRTALDFAGIPEADVIGKPFWQTPWWSHSIDLQLQLRNAIVRAAAGECVRFEASHIGAEGDTRFVDFSLKPVYDDDGHIHLLVPEGRDITDRKRAEEELTRAARLDKLTGLPNRGLLLDRLKQTILRAQRSQDFRYALMFLDFDRFKIINDSLGHEAGDDLLRQIGVRLRGNIRSLDSVSRTALGNTTSRLGGDEFVVLLDELELPSDVLVVAKRLLTAFMQPYRIGSQEVYSTASIGIVMGGAEYERAEDVLRDADTAMYEAKRAGKARYVVFDASMRERLQRRLRLESDLRKAIEANELSLACQPILSLSTGEIRSVELLLRWKHPTEGPIGPGEFVPIAEESDLIHFLGEWALVTGCRQMAQWIETLGPAAPATVSINLSRKQFAMPDLLGRIRRALAETGLDPQRLQLEITEDAFVMDERAAIDTMRAIRGLGVHLAIDDFGAGSSSFASVHRFPVDTIKVDRSLLAGIEDSPDTAALIHALAVLVKNLGICMVAEGVETPAQALALQELGCHHAQGYFFAAPMAVPDFEQFLSRSISIDHAESGAMAFAARWADRLSL